jgi:hypothetical protein
MKCEAIESKIALHASGDLEAGDSAAINSHISHCPACASRLLQFREDLRALRSLREDPVGQSDCDAARRSVMARVGLRGGRAGRFHNLYRPASVAAAAAASIALLVWWLSYPRTAHAPHETAPAAAEAVKHAGPAVTASIREAVPAAAHGSNPNRNILRTGGRKAHVTPGPEIPSLSAASKPNPFTTVQLPPDDIAIRLETADPNVVIIWLASSKGGEPQ